MSKYTRFLIIQFIFLFVVKGFAQNGDKPAESKPAAADFNYNSQIELLGKVYVVKVEKKETSDVYKYTVTITAPAAASAAASASDPAGASDNTTDATEETTSATETSHAFKLIELKPDVFRTEFISAIKKFDTPTGGTSTAAEEAARMELLRKEADRLFYNVVATSFDTKSQAPQSGYMTFDNFKSKGENKEPVIVAHDYFSYYAGIGWSKNKMLESVAKNTRELYKVRNKLVKLYTKRTLNPMPESVAKDSVEIKFDLKETKVEKMLTDAQGSYLRSRGYGEEELDIIFPKYLNKETLYLTGIRKPNKQLSIIVENIQHAIANIKGEIRRERRQQGLYATLAAKQETQEKKKKALDEARKCLEEATRIVQKKQQLQEQLARTELALKLTEQEVQSLEAKLTSVSNEIESKGFSLALAPSRADSLKTLSDLRRSSQSKQQVEKDILNKRRTLDDLTAGMARVQTDLRNISQVVLLETNTRLQANLAKLNSLNSKRDVLKNQGKSEPKRQEKERNDLNESVRADQAFVKCLSDEASAQQAFNIAEAEFRAAAEEVKKAEEDLNKPVTPEGLRVHRIQVEFSAGNLKNIMVIGTMKADGHNKEDSIKFINPYPIPFSAIRDFNYGAQLYSFNHRDPPSNYRYWIHLSDVFRYVPKFYVDAEDYSPADVAFTVIMDDKQGKYKVLERSTVDKLLDARIYSDFVGLDDDTPNGLIQAEVSKRIILRPKRKSVILNRIPFGFGGFFNYIEPYAALLKVENKNKYLKLNGLYTATDITLETDNTSRQFTLASHTSSFARTIDILRYANFNIGAKLNLLVLDVPQVKSSYFLDIGTTLYRTAVLDSIGVVAKDSRENLLVDTATGKLIYNPVLNRYNATSLMSFLELTWQIKPDHRLGFSVSPRISYFDLKSPRFQQVAKLADTDADTGGGTPFWMFNVQVNAFVLPSENGRLFFRANYTFMYDNQKQDFFQAQLGYAFNILKRKPGN